MQVAAKEMPVNSVIVGVDLVPIAPIPNCKSIVADITTDKCRQLLRAAVLNNKADVVLHDGAPNVGTAWTIDEYSQAALCLKAFSLATEFLRKGGWFITKVFRSRDYEPLKWAISQFFRKVGVLKPEASRAESAEIFLVCQSYLDPSSIDPKFLDPKHVFGEIEMPKSRETVVSSLLKISKQKKKAEGYEDDKLYKETLLSEFLNSDDPLRLLAKTNKIIVDREELLDNPLTPKFLRNSFEDIQVLGKPDIRAMLNWRRKVLAALEKEKESTMEPKAVEFVQEEHGSEDEDEAVQKEVSRLLEEEQKSSKKRLKAVRKAKRKLAERIVLKLEHPGDVIEQNNAGELFSLASIGGRDLDSIQEVEKDFIEQTGHTVADLMILKEEQAKRREILNKRKEDFRRAVEGGDYVKFDRDGDYEIDLGDMNDARPTALKDRDDIYLSSSEDEVEEPKEKRRLGGEGEVDDDLTYSSEVDGSDSDMREVLDTDSEDEDEYAKALAREAEFANKKQKRKGTLLTDLDPADEETKKKQKIDSWCKSAELKQLLNIASSDSEEEDEDEGESKGITGPPAKKLKAEKAKPASKKTKQVLFADGVASESKKAGKAESKNDNDESDVEETGGEDFDKDDDADSVSSDEDTKISKKEKKKLKRLRRPLTDTEKALAQKLIQSAKSRRDLLDWNFHRFRFFEDESTLPDWFVKDEKVHMRKQPPMEDVGMYCQSRPVQGKTLKKAEEARARKKMKAKKRLESVRRRADNLPDDLTEKEAWGKIKAMYKKAGLLKKKRRPISLVVNTKSGSKATKQQPSKGAKVKLVDKRMKSDLRGQARAAARKRGRGRGGRR
nr:rrna methyltransferase 3 [Hymenolepis microstoma]